MNVFEYAALCEKNYHLNLENLGVSEPKYTFYGDLSIAEFCELYAGDPGAVRDTFNRVFESWKGSYKALTEFIIALNYKSWAFAGEVDSTWLKCSERNRLALVELYSKLYYEGMDKFYEIFEGNEEACDWFFEMTD